MKTTLAWILGIVILIQLSPATAQRTCYSNNYLHEQLAADPAFAANRQQIEDFTAAFVKKGGAAVLERGTATYNIPVVVHVVYNTTAQNITDAQIQSQIDVLNKDYQLNNADTNSVPTVFRSVRADCKIQFCLAKRDPSGLATTGIIRKQTAVTAFSTNDYVKSNTMGGDDPWSSASYLNLWVCNLSGGILGYSQFPGGAATTDGVVIQYTAFGTTGTATAPFNLGRTTTHEVGHWLNLYHIWGDDGTACTGTDNVGDTPNQGAENYGCPVFPRISCSNGPNGDMFMNYMDYVDDKCMMMFTLGQRDRMYAVLGTGGARASLASSLGCVAPSTSTTCNPPSGVTVGSITSNAATISWGAVTGAASYVLQYKKASDASYITVNAIKTTSYTLSNLATSTSYNYRVATNCTSGTSAYIAVASFTTKSALISCTDSYESNNTLGTAAAIAVKTNINSQISGKTDVDYFKFTNTATEPNITINLTNLPADYDLTLLSSTGTVLKTSAIRGTNSEFLTYNTTTVGTYIVNVKGYNSAYSATYCYTLNVGISNSAVRTMRMSANEIAERTAVKVFPTPSDKELSLEFSGYNDGMAELSMIGVSGTSVLRKIVRVANESIARVDTSNIPDGLYYLRTQQGDKSNIEKVLIHHQ